MPKVRLPYVLIVLVFAPLAFYGGFAIHGWAGFALYVGLLIVPGSIAAWSARRFRS